MCYSSMTLCFLMRPPIDGLESGHRQLCLPDPRVGISWESMNPCGDKVCFSQYTLLRLQINKKLVIDNEKTPFRYPLSLIHI